MLVIVTILIQENFNYKIQKYIEFVALKPYIFVRDSSYKLGQEATPKRYNIVYSIKLHSLAALVHYTAEIIKHFVPIIKNIRKKLI